MNAREALRRDFLARCGWGNARIESLAPDASFRRYFRLRRGAASALLMDAPPPVERLGAFIAVTDHLARLGARVPVLDEHDLEHGFLLLEDLGDKTFSRLLDGGFDDTMLYPLALDALVDIQRHPRAAEIALPAYHADDDPASPALAEVRLLTDWYLPAQLARPAEAAVAESFARIWSQTLSALPPLAPTLVLRDFHVDNLMLVDGECALLDYQDALLGSPAYDLASLLEDARRDLAPELAQAMLWHYRRRNPDVAADALHRHCIVWAAQRHCKVAGIFVRLWLRDGKDAYLAHLPRVMRLLQRHLHEQPLWPLRDWLERHLGDLRNLGALRHRDGLDHAARETARGELLRCCGDSLNRADADTTLAANATATDTAK
ncbi:MAG: aminoglycoside phosphotransferase family protein [bacterium]